MFKNYFKIAFRNLLRNKGFSIINISGLALGIATCLLIVLYLQSQLGYDRYNEKADRIVRVVFNAKMQGHDIKEASVMPPVAQTLKKDFPEVQAATRIRAVGKPRISYGDKLFKDDELAFVDANFFSVFTLPLIKGNAATALVQPNTVLITKQLAHKFFGNADPIGKVLTFKDNNAQLTVTGEIDEVPANSHFHFELFGAMAGLNEAKEMSWMQSNFYTYLVLPSGYDPKTLEAKMPGVVEKYMGPQLQKAMGVTYAQFKQQGNQLGFRLQPLTDIHLHSNFTGELEPSGNITYVYIFSAVAIFMLLIACINFINLSTASASKRAKEVGVRKVMGSGRSQLAWQFMLESLLLTLVALCVAVVIVYIALPLFNSFTNLNLKLSFLANLRIIPVLLLFGLVTGILAGAYPAFFLSSFNPVTVLKGKFTSGKKSQSLRSGLVVFQFFISILLIIGTTVVYKQLSFIHHAQLGYDKDRVVVIQDTYWLGKDQGIFKELLRQDPRVESLSSSGYLPAGNSSSNNYLAYPDTRSTELINSRRYEVDENYIRTLGMHLAMGRNFSKQYGTDSSAMIINQTAAKAFGWGNNALGHTITRPGENGKLAAYTVVGIVKDFHFSSLHDLITPLVMTLGGDGTIIVKVKPGDITGVLTAMRKAWDGLKPAAPFSYSFLDDRFNNTYKAEQNIGRIMGVFAGLTIFVACLGLFGLATFTAERRTKEIGIRKVLGANASGLVALLSADFFKLVFIAFIIAAPAAWYFMNNWLQSFAYRISIDWLVFAIAAFVVASITLLTISYQSIRAALGNPVDALKTE
ncbi:MAG: ABC transporter permease [Bacteroidota bacterium]